MDGWWFAVSLLDAISFLQFTPIGDNDPFKLGKMPRAVCLHVVRGLKHVDMVSGFATDLVWMDEHEERQEEAVPGPTLMTLLELLMALRNPS